ncbi:MerR family transcriptional regulator [Clostridium baratii]|uniref:MerR family transcriptional regulator n=1 Tax=Clostridium baratii TaxID=1561 RepID=UPI0030D4D441
MDIKFTVGELAKLHNLSKQTLIFYDKIGLFKPKIIDSNNNYRYYTSEQLEVLDSILILKEIGIPLKEIKTFLEDRNIDSTLELMKKQKKELKKTRASIKINNKKINK